MRLTCLSTSVTFASCLLLVSVHSQRGLLTCKFRLSWTLHGDLGYSRFTKEMKDESAGLLAAVFIGIAPGYISRSVAGSYDNEAIAIFLLMFTFFCWIKALKTGSVLFGTLTALFYFYMVAAWG